MTPPLTKRGRFVVDETIGISLLIASQFKDNPCRINVIASNLYNAQKIYDLLSIFIGEENCLFFPVDEMLRVDAVAASKEMLSQRLFVMDSLSNKEHYVLITHGASCGRYLPNPSLFKNMTMEFKIGEHYNLEDVKTKLTMAGYTRVNKIDHSLQFASRGDILDVYSVNNTRPIRMEFFDDELENIRIFEISTQRSVEALEQVKILPATDIIYTEEEKNHINDKINSQYNKDLSRLDEVAKERLNINIQNDLESFSLNNISERLYKYYGYLQDHHYSILDYSFDSINIICNRDGLETSLNLLLEETNDYLMHIAEDGTCISHLQMYQHYSEFLFSHSCIDCSPLASSQDDVIFNVRSILGGTSSIAGAINLINNYLERNDKVVLLMSTEQQKKSIIDLLNEENIAYEEVNGFELPKGKLGIALFNLDEGFELQDYHIAYLTSKELLGYHNKTSRFLNRYKEAVILKSYEELEPGDYIVHEQNGIGKFLDIVTMETDGIHRDYLHIQYAGNDVLYVPLEQFRLVRKFVGKEGVAPKLNKLNSTEWERTKERIKNRVNDIADKLIALYAERQSVKGFAFNEDDEFQAAFEAQFPFELTDDQARSLREIKEDMEASTPMDRLLCGDVGFGKTELAFRAAFKAISSGKQVAFLCPTTLLARQHYERALERFSSFGIKVALLSRLVPDSIQKAYMQNIEEGRIHLVIGTHRLLSKELHFKDLGLLIIDEEQRFGVEQKERIKEIKTNLDVLTLTATPIPRTLQMSLVGIRSLSQLNSAPMNRMPIQTYVMPYKDDVVKELLQRELGRKGQVFYIHNVVSTIYTKATHITKLVPNARVAVVHGQMERDEIEDTMVKFYNGEIDILVCTSIIETGIDIANANMIIIENADCFGLSQLYQIKGRVGRGSRIAYAYLLYKANKEMNDIAKKRLKAIQDFTELGAGFKIAQRDLMIRGAGDILGAEQAGFIDTVGIDMYMKLLNEAIQEKKTGKKEELPKAKKSLKIDAYIPSSYAGKGDKIELYQEIENSKEFNDLQLLKDKVQDIYGHIPDEVERLFTKRKLELFIKHPCFKDIVEYEERIDIICSREFSCIDGIGVILFQSLANYLSIIKVNLIGKELKISFYKKNDDWFRKYEQVLEIIYLLGRKYEMLF